MSFSLCKKRKPSIQEKLDNLIEFVSHMREKE